MRRAVLYARVSSDDRGKEGRNLASQLEMGRKYAQEKGLTVVAELAEDDRGASGASLDLPQLNRALEMADAGEYDVFVVREMDRLARGLGKQLYVEDRLRRAGVSISYVLADYSDDPEGDLMKHIRGSVAEYERLKIRERTMRAKGNKVKSGSVSTATPPYGYRKAQGEGTKTTLAIVPEEAENVRLIFSLYLSSDGGLRAVADELTRLGIPKPKDSSRSAQWSHRTVAYILSNETYIGKWNFGKERWEGTEHRKGVPQPRENWVTVPVPPIIDRATFDAAQARRVTNTAQAHNPATHEYMLGGRVTCGHCGYAYSGSSAGTYRRKDGTERIRTYYTHTPATDRDHYTQPGLTCGAYFLTSRLDEAVWQWVVNLVRDPGSLAEGLRAQQAAMETASVDKRKLLDGIEGALTEERRKYRKLLDLFLDRQDDEFSREVFAAKETDLKKRISALEHKRDEYARTLEAQTLTDRQITEMETFAQEVARGLGRGAPDFAKRRQLITDLNVTVTLSVEDGVKVAYARCYLCNEPVRVMDIAS